MAQSENQCKNLTNKLKSEYQQMEREHWVEWERVVKVAKNVSSVAATLAKIT